MKNIHIHKRKSLKLPFLYLFVLLLLLLSVPSMAQIGKQIGGRHHNFPLTFAMGSAFDNGSATAGLASTLYPVVSFGTEYYYLRKDHFDYYQSISVSYSAAKNSSTAVLFATETGFRYKHMHGLYADLGFGMTSVTLFKHDDASQSSGSSYYGQESEVETLNILIDVFVAAGYDFAKTSQVPLSIYMKLGKYIALQSELDVPELPHTFLQIGARYYLFKNL